MVEVLAKVNATKQTSVTSAAEIQPRLIVTASVGLLDSLVGFLADLGHGSLLPACPRGPLPTPPSLPSGRGYDRTIRGGCMFCGVVG